MALPTTPSSWMRGLDLPSQLFETGSDDYELYEEDGEFVLSVELPGFGVGEIDVTWDDGMLNVAAEYEDDEDIAASRRPRQAHRNRGRTPTRFYSSRPQDGT